jgi:hypothetical protein
MFVWTFLLRITHTIISQSNADSFWITLYTYNYVGSVTFVGRFVCVDYVHKDMLMITGEKLKKFISQHTLEYRYLQHSFTKLISNVICVPINKSPINFQTRIRVLSRFCQEEGKDIFHFQYELRRHVALCPAGLALSSRMIGDLLTVPHPPPWLAQGQSNLYFCNLWLGVIDLRRFTRRWTDGAKHCAAFARSRLK